MTWPRLLWAFVLASLVVVRLSAGDLFVQLVIDNTSGGVGFTSAQIDPPGEPQMQVAYCRVRTAQISYTLHGVAPTTSVGTLLNDGETLTIEGHERLFKFRAIRVSSTTAGLDCNLSSTR